MGIMSEDVSKPEIKNIYHRVNKIENAF